MQGAGKNAHLYLHLYPRNVSDYLRLDLPARFFATLFLAALAVFFGDLRGLGRRLFLR